MENGFSVVIRGIQKRFGKIVALSNIDLDVRRGEVHALLGENGAGKTTLVRILAGELKPDSGTVIVNGQIVRSYSPEEARKNGIGFVAQNFRLISHLTVEENLSLLLPDKKTKERAKSIACDLGWTADWDTEVSSLSMGERQRLEIARVVASNPEILIFDEPTSSLTPHETESLFSLIRDRVASGRTVLYISHRLREVVEIADRVTILRRGQKVGTFSGDTPADRLAELMVGPLTLTQPTGPERAAGPVLLQVEDMWVRAVGGGWAVRAADLTVRSGEVVVIVGVDGNGQRELMEALWGLRPMEKGRVWFDGERVIPDPSYWTTKGAAYLPPEGARSVAFLSWSLKENALVRLRDRFRWFLSVHQIGPVAQGWKDAYFVQADSVDQKLEELSGGNRQRWALAMVTALPVKMLFLYNPTHGLDVAGMSFVHHLILNQRRSGSGILLVSTDLDQALQLGDCVLVIYKGRLHPVTDRTSQTLGLLMGGMVVR